MTLKLDFSLCEFSIFSLSIGIDFGILGFKEIAAYELDLSVWSTEGATVVLSCGKVEEWGKWTGFESLVADIF